MSFRERMEWLGRMAILGMILAATAFLSAITAMRLAIQGREVEVPHVVRMKAGDAQALLASRMLGMKIDDRIYSDLPTDHVVRQSPPAGARIKITQRAHVVLSLGPQKVSIPDLEQHSLRAARMQLLRAGLQVGEISQCYLPEYEPEVVIQQNPPPRATDAGSPRVSLLVSLGQREPAYVMPDVTGLPLIEAQRQLSAGGLRLSKITFAPSAEIRRGTVTSQIPARGARVPPGTLVELQVAE